MKIITQDVADSGVCGKDTSVIVENVHFSLVGIHRTLATFDTKYLLHFHFLKTKRKQLINP